MTALNNINTLYLLLFENRSFDHLLGHISLPAFGGAPVEGLKGALGADGFLSGNTAYSNFFGSDLYAPFHLTDGTLPIDLPH